jgi:hypothetical protein
MFTEIWTILIEMTVATVKVVYPGALLFIVSSGFLVFWLPSWYRILDSFLIAQLQKMAM